jgi:oligopeptide/dipeptide ABC transporter ATP-binding protein
MYAGKIVETGPANTILNAPKHPYTAGLIGAIPSRNKRGARLQEIPGMIPSPMHVITGCSFADRCTHTTKKCQDTKIEMRSVGSHHQTRCIIDLEGA